MPAHLPPASRLPYVQTAMAGRSRGGNSMAMTACFAGPLFNMLVGLGIGFWSLLQVGLGVVQVGGAGIGGAARYWGCCKVLGVLQVGAGGEAGAGTRPPAALTQRVGRSMQQRHRANQSPAGASAFGCTSITAAGGPRQGDGRLARSSSAASSCPACPALPCPGSISLTLCPLSSTLQESHLRRAAVTMDPVVLVGCLFIMLNCVCEPGRSLLGKPAVRELLQGGPERCHSLFLQQTWQLRLAFHLACVARPCPQA